jgi:hypothetical protein
MKTVIVLFLLILSLTAISQDKIIKKSGATIECKVTEIDADEVKYHYADNPNLTFGIDKVLVDKVEFSTGEVIVIEGNSFKNAEYYVNQHKHALKINFLSPITGSTEFIYEQSIKPGKSWETALGIIGLGADPQGYNPQGAFGKFAYKFLRSPDFYMHSMHYAHILKGAYFAPELALRYMSYDANNYDYYYSSTYSETSTRKEKFDMAFLLKFGKQWVFDDSFLVDIYAGIGYGIGGDNNDILNYGFIIGSKETPVAYTGGIRVGWVFKK